MRALALRNVSIESPGTFGEFLKRNGFTIDDIDLSKGERCPATADGYDVTLIMGGPMNVYEEDKHPFLADELRLLQEAAKNGRKVIGFCLGCQMIARALGAKVTKNPVKEIGWMPVMLTDAGKREPLLAGLPETLTVFQWHGDTFAVPAGAAHLVKSEACVNQAFRHGNMLALQYHPEVEEADVRGWSDEYLAELLRERGVRGKEQLVAETKRSFPRMLKDRDLFYGNLLRWILER